MVLLKIAFPAFLFSLVLCEWIEIAQVKNGKTKFPTTSPSYEITLNKPQIEEHNEGYIDVEDEEQEESSALLTLVKRVQNELLDFKGRSLTAKTEHLEKLRDNMLSEIKYRISRLFKSSAEGESRLYKDYHYSDEHQVDYPSNEGALLTIGFLTFSVFLIKLVLKLIYAFKLKHQYYNYQTRTTPAPIFLRQNERELHPKTPEDESARILRYLDEYPPA